MTRETARSLSQFPIFAGLSKRDLARADSLVTETSFEPGAVLCLEDDYGREAFVIVSGTVEISHGDDLVATCGPGDVVGERALLGDGRRTATATAVGTVDVLAMSMQEFHSLLNLPGVDEQIRLP